MTVMILTYSLVHARSTILSELVGMSFFQNVVLGINPHYYKVREGDFVAEADLHENCSSLFLS